MVAQPDSSVGDTTHLFDAGQFKKALAHPIRMRIFADARRQDVSPSDFARESGLPLSAVSKHFTRLRRCGAIELVGRKEIRGAVKHFYRATPRAVFTCEVGETLGHFLQCLFDEQGRPRVQTETRV